MAENTLIVGTKEGVKPISGATPEEGNKKSFFSPARIVGLFILAVLLVLIVRHYRGNAEDRQLALLQANNRELELLVATKGAGASQATTPAPDPVYYGNFKIGTGTALEEIEVPAGYSLEVGWVDKLAVDYYVDRKLKHHCPVLTPGQGTEKFVVTHKHQAGFRVSAGQAKTETRLGYVIYLGNELPKNWWARALAAPDQTQAH